MQYRTFSEPKSSYKYAILTQKLEADGIIREYLAPYNIPEEDVIAYQLHITGKKTSRAEQKEYLKDCQDHGWLKSTYDDGSQKHHFWFTGSDVDYTWWKMKWSEYFDQSFQLDILD